MKFTYDKNIDALYVSFRTSEVQRTVEISDGFNADFDEKGKLVGIELLNASEAIPPKDLTCPIQIITV